MLGSILSNILLVLGCCFIAGGITHKEQSFNSTVASTMSSLMAVASASLIIPATLYAVLDETQADTDANILILSHGSSIILLFVYVMYLYFQLKSHADLFDDENQDTGDEEPQLLKPLSAGVVLVIITVAVAVCAEYLVDSINPIVETVHISKTFIGLILIPIVGNAAEHVTAVVVAWKDKMDLAIGVAIGSSLQIALFVTPFLVILGWIMDRDMTLHFETFETVAFFLSTLVVTLLIQDGKSNYLEGVMCLVSANLLVYQVRELADWSLGHVCHHCSRFLRVSRQARSPKIHSGRVLSRAFLGEITVVWSDRLQTLYIVYHRGKDLYVMPRRLVRSLGIKKNGMAERCNLLGSYLAIHPGVRLSPSRPQDIILS
jgi:calcium/proton exchanger cax